MKPSELSIPDLPKALSRLLHQVPCGRVTTYGDLAKALGDVKAARWVGEFLLDHAHTAECPCHRVVLKSGDVGLYITRNSDEKIARLQGEGIEVSKGRVPLKEFGYASFESSQPLRELKQMQMALPARNRFDPLPALPDYVGGIDVSYSKQGEASGCYTLMRLATMELVWSHVITVPAAFPYIPGYLSFREIPVHLQLLETAKRSGHSADVLIVDGNGILHHRFAGIATHLGIAAGQVTIGIGKSLLCGSVDVSKLDPGETSPVYYADQHVGAAVKASSRSRPIFVSPGYGIDVTSAVRVVQACFAGHRLPEPLYWADRLSRVEARQDRP